MDVKLLEDIGLTQGEIKVYLALLRLGSTATGQLASTAGVSSSKVYKILDRLGKKGLVGHVMRGKVKYFSAMEPKRLLVYLEEEQAKLSQNTELVKQMIPDLEKQQKAAEQKTGASIYEGPKAFTNFYRNILDELKEGDTYYVIGATYGDVPGIRNFFLTYHRRRKEIGIKVKMLANYDVRDNLEKTTWENADIRFLPQYLISNTTIVFYKNKVFIAIFTKDPRGFLLESSEAVKSFQNYFNALWKIAKH